jgi:hypothetical protein
MLNLDATAEGKREGLDPWSPASMLLPVGTYQVQLADELDVRREERTLQPAHPMTSLGDAVRECVRYEALYAYMNRVIVWSAEAGRCRDVSLEAANYWLARNMLSLNDAIDEALEDDADAVEAALLVSPHFVGRVALGAVKAYVHFRAKAFADSEHAAERQAAFSRRASEAALVRRAVGVEEGA